MNAMNTKDLERLLMARAQSYQISELRQVKGRLYLVRMSGQEYRAVLLMTSFAYYRALSPGKNTAHLDHLLYP